MIHATIDDKIYRIDEFTANGQIFMLGADELGLDIRCCPPTEPDVIVDGGSDQQALLSDRVFAKGFEMCGGVMDFSVVKGEIK